MTRAPGSKVNEGDKAGKDASNVDPGIGGAVGGARWLVVCRHREGLGECIDVDVDAELES